MDTPAAAGIDLYWIPLGIGGNGYVRLNGRLYEAVRARLDKRPPAALYHTALIVQAPAGRYIVECAWPGPDAHLASRGVVVAGPVFARRLGGLRPFRYEVRCWRDGVIPDLAQAVGGPQRVGHGAEQAALLLDLVREVPALTWGRDESTVGEMWNSNSVISWVLVRAGVPVTRLSPPPGGRAPGWRAGVVVAGGPAADGA